MEFETWETGSDFLLQATLRRITKNLERFILKIAHLLHVKAVFFKKTFTNRDFSFIFLFKICEAIKYVMRGLTVNFVYVQITLTLSSKYM